MRIDGLLVRLGSSSFLLFGLIRGPGCGGSFESSSDTATRAGSSDSPSGKGTDPTESPAYAGADAGAPSPNLSYRGNPLCHVTDYACLPDEDGSRATTGAQACAQPYEPDAGESAAFGCRLERTSATQSISPGCKEADRGGTDGVACQTGRDCAPGFDCVEGEKGSVCRHYCCADTCDGKTSQSGGKTFCDVQKLVDTNEKAPVCMPLKACKLLTAGACAATETCAVVTDTGETGCVEIGQAQVNDSCDTEHCAVGLTCIGQPGARKCYQLCKVGSSSSCGSSLVCKTSTMFKDPAYGVCQKPTSAF